ncbi:ras-related protein Rab-2-like [Octopus sinensis]|uniref:Ras-related protein Rab-2-like n=1 Tax=Octopus sinensis TaxID=2607531 RepID=A0A6P7U506_9MOLL|nr:ras-related protein Rab-2-like [Octopus sinensis]
MTLRKSKKHKYVSIGLFFVSLVFKTSDSIFLRLNNYLFKILIVGDSGVGKSALLKQFTQSFKNVIRTWIEEIKSASVKPANCVLVGNKCDLEGNERVVPREEGELFAKAHNMIYIETSAKSGENVEDLFHQSAKEIKNDFDRGIPLTSKPQVNIIKSHPTGKPLLKTCCN